jgi:hypothetical protein
MSGKKGLGVVMSFPSISFEGGVVEMVACGAFRVMLDPKALTSFCRVIRVHTRVRDVDNGVRRAGGEASIGRAAGIGSFLGPPAFSVFLRGTKTCRGSRTAGGILAGVVRNFHASASSFPRGDFFPDGSAMQCKAPSWSAMQEMDPKWKISLGLKVIIVLKMIAMESSSINVAAPTWRASCRCLGPDCAPREYPRGAFE